jgi:hypothetical protein
MTAIPTPQPLRLLHRPLVRVEVTALVLVAAGAFPQPVRALVAVPALLLLPGYATLIALRLTGGKPADGTQTVLMSLITSMAVVPLLLLGLHALGMPLVAGAMMPAVAVYCAIVALLGGRAAAGIRPVDNDLVATGGRVVAAAVAAAGIIAVGLHVLPGAPEARYSALAFGGSWAKLEGPVFAAPATPVDVPVTVTNHTGTAKRYVLRPHMTGASWKPRVITVEPGATWSGAVSGSVPRGGCLHRLLIGLSAENDRIGGLTVWFQSRRTLPNRCDAGAAR